MDLLKEAGFLAWAEGPGVSGSKHFFCRKAYSFLGESLRYST